MAYNKEQLKLINNALNRVAGDIKQITRENICRKQGIVSEYGILKQFGSFSNFVDACKDCLKYGCDEQCEYEPEEEAVRPGKIIDPTLRLKQELDSATPDTTGYIRKENYWYNTNTGDYIFDFTDVASISRPISLPKQTVYAILQDYSNFDASPKSINAIAIKHQIPPFILKKLLHRLEVTHDSLPITDELLEETADDGKLVEDLISLRKFNIHQQFQQSNWKLVQDNANKWARFEAGVLNPISDVLSEVSLPQVDWNLTDFPDVARDSCEDEWDEDETYVIALSDIHFGAFADKNNMFFTDEDWTIEKTQEAVWKYSEQIAEDMANRKKKPGKCLVVSVGDICDSLKGITDKGTPLNTHYKGVSQFKVALTSISLFLQCLARIWQDRPISVKAVSGNHDSFADWALFTALDHMHNKRIDFEIASQRWLMFQDGANLFIMEHGYSAKYKHKVPTSDIGKENYVQKLLLEKIGEFKQPIKHRYFLMGDRHSYNQKEMSSFEFIQLPTLVGGDEYADALGLSSRQRQMAFILDAEKGVTQMLNFYFDC